jgi:hypothetical protein
MKMSRSIWSVALAGVIVSATAYAGAPGEGGRGGHAMSRIGSGSAWAGAFKMPSGQVSTNGPSGKAASSVQKNPSIPAKGNSGSMRPNGVGKIVDPIPSQTGGKTFPRNEISEAIFKSKMKIPPIVGPSLPPNGNTGPFPPFPGKGGKGPFPGKPTPGGPTSPPPSGPGTGGTGNTGNGNGTGNVGNGNTGDGNGIGNVVGNKIVNVNLGGFGGGGFAGGFGGGGGGGFVESGPVVMAASDAVAAVSPAAPPATVINPAGTGATLTYLVAGDVRRLAPGNAEELPAGAVIEFDRGGNFGSTAYTLVSGPHSFGLTEKGWDLFQGVLSGTAKLAQR